MLTTSRGRPIGASTSTARSKSSAPMFSSSVWRSRNIAASMKRSLRVGVGHEFQHQRLRAPSNALAHRRRQLARAAHRRRGSCRRRGSAAMPSFVTRHSRPRSKRLGVAASAGSAAASPASQEVPALHRSRPDHRVGAHPAVEVRRAHVAQRERGLAQRGALAVRLLRDLGGAVVADVRRERGHQHERALDQLADARLVRLDAARAMLLERAAAVGEQPRALQEGMDDHRLVDVELEVARGAADRRPRRRCRSPGRTAWSTPRPASG